MSEQTERNAVDAAGEPGGTGDGMLNVVPDSGSGGGEPEQGPEVAGSSGTGEITDGGADATLSDTRGTGGTGDMGPE